DYGCSEKKSHPPRVLHDKPKQMLSDAKALRIWRQAPESGEGQEERRSAMVGNSQGRAIGAAAVGGAAFGRLHGRPAAHVDPSPHGLARILPPELGFLAQQGVPPDKLLAALSVAPGGVLPLEAVLAAGVIDDELYYAALARRLGSTYYRGTPAFAPGF